MLLEDLLLEAEITTLLETPTDLPADADLVTQLEILMTRLAAAKRALGITNRITNPKERKKHRSRVMIFLNKLRAMFDRVVKQMQADQQTDDTGIMPQYRHAA